jgi:tRNA(His) guanylyltransferase
MSKDSLGDRIKKYENSFRQQLPIRIPLIIRLDGASFHNYLKGCKRPIDENVVECMNESAKYLCKNIQGAQLAYVQSDEISILINNYQSLNTEPWFDNSLQKIVSISAGMVSSYFSSISDRIFGKIKLATFDCRAFVVPKEDVCNAFIFRQQDATRNSVQMLAQSLYSHRELLGKNNSQLQEMCFKKGFNWNNCPIYQKRGRCIVKSKIIKPCKHHKTNDVFNVERSEWVVDNKIPIFSQNRNYINQYV